MVWRLGNDGAGQNLPGNRQLTNLPSDLSLSCSGGSTFLQRGSPPPPPWRLLPEYMMFSLTRGGDFLNVRLPICGGVAQLVRALPCHGRGYGFEPRHSRQGFQVYFPCRSLCVPASCQSGGWGDARIEAGACPLSLAIREASWAIARRWPMKDLRGTPGVSPRLSGTLASRRTTRVAGTTQRFLFLYDPIEAVGKIGRLRVNQIQNIADGLIGGDGGPIDEIGRGLQDIVAAGRAGEFHLEYIVGI